MRTANGWIRESPVSNGCCRCFYFGEMTNGLHSVDPHTGRPLDVDGEAIDSLSAEELERELTLAAIEHARYYRFQRLLAERRRRLLAA